MDVLEPVELAYATFGTQTSRKTIHPILVIIFTCMMFLGSALIAVVSLICLLRDDLAIQPVLLFATAWIYMPAFSVLFQVHPNFRRAIILISAEIIIICVLLPLTTFQYIAYSSYDPVFQTFNYALTEAMVIRSLTEIWLMPNVLLLLYAVKRALDTRDPINPPSGTA